MRYEKKESIGCIYEQSDVEECHVESSSCKIRKIFFEQGMRNSRVSWNT